ncbi:unnamed protein product [Rhizophagus irregularis]|nr:unnamed protein product [Rhizophagus irregularis]
MEVCYYSYERSSQRPEAFLLVLYTADMKLICCTISCVQTLGNVSTNGSKSYVLRLANLSSNLTKEKWIVHNNGSYFSLVMRVTFFRFIHDQLFPSVTKN